MLDRWVWYKIFSYLSPLQLLCTSEVCHEWLEYARAEEVWRRHRKRVLDKLPMLQSLFEDGKRPSWNVFTMYLLPKFEHVARVNGYETELVKEVLFPSIIHACFKNVKIFRPSIKGDTISAAISPASTKGEWFILYSNIDMNTVFNMYGRRFVIGFGNYHLRIRANITLDAKFRLIINEQQEESVLILKLENFDAPFLVFK